MNLHDIAITPNHRWWTIHDHPLWTAHIFAPDASGRLQLLCSNVQDSNYTEETLNAIGWTVSATFPTNRCDRCESRTNDPLYRTP